VSEQLLQANPQSAQAARDVSVSLERLAGAVGASSAPGAPRNALALQERALEIARRLRDRNPRSVFYGRTAAVSAYLASKCARTAGEQRVADQHLRECHGFLRELVDARAQLDAPMVQLYNELERIFGGPTSVPPKIALR
jgi:hypothetical protein